MPGHFRAVLTDGLVNRVSLSSRQRHQRAAVDGHADHRLFSPGTACNLEHGRQDIDEAAGIGRCTLADPRPGDDQRHPRGVFEEVHLVPEPALAQHITMVSGDDEDGILEHPRLSDGLHQLTDLAVEV